MSIGEKKATRLSYGEELVNLGIELPNIVVLDADLAGATKTDLFRKKFPDRHINCGIAEANMIGISAGLSTCGLIPFASTFAMFAAGRAYEQIRNSICYPNLNVKIAATHAGISVGEDGASHQCIEDFSLMRTLPNMVVLSPCDDIETKQALRAAAIHNGPVYIRLGRYAVSKVNSDNYQFSIGKGTILKNGTDLSIITTGLTVAPCLEAAEKLDKLGLSTEVINISTIKPLDKDLIISSARKTKKIVTVEEHSIIGGLGSAVLEALSDTLPIPVYPIGIYDQFGESASASELIHKYKLDAEGIYDQIVKKFIR